MIKKDSQKYRNRAVWEDVNKLYNFEDFENDKFIDLGLNCSQTPEPIDCQRLNYTLVVPEGAEPVPLWFIQNQLLEGRALAIDMHERARGLQARDAEGSNEGTQPAAHTASMLHFMNNRVADEMVKLNEEAQYNIFMTKVLQEKLIAEYNMTSRTFHRFLAHQKIRVTGSESCRDRRKNCDGAAKFRSLDGSCNNIVNPSWGQSNTAFLRLLPARYSDGIHALATSVSGNVLPSTRVLSTQLFSRRSGSRRADSFLTLSLMQWGQILAHDFARQAIDQTDYGGIECCDDGGSTELPKSLQHHSCAPIEIPPTDEFYREHNQTCMNFVRSLTVAREDCTLGAAQQLNGVSSFLDLSSLYGSDEAANEPLREFQRGRMRTEIRGERVMPPTSLEPGFCDVHADSDVCFQTGDARTNQSPQLIVLQTLLIREHNRVARELARLNSHWDDERIFQESRRIVIAQYQHITYRYWLPLVIGKKYCREHKICTSSAASSTDYDARINPSTTTAFSSGAFRFLHSLVDGEISLVDAENETTASLRLSDHYFRPRVVESNENFESLLRGLFRRTMRQPGSDFHPEVSGYLFRSSGSVGMDLRAIDVQRGRDHGLPGYNAYRELCQLGRADDFYGLVNEISLKNIEQLQRMYEDVNDIDLLIGATLENRLPGTLLGPTFQCLIGEQFYRTRVGDRYFYNNANFVHSFTSRQLEQVQKANLGTWICDLGRAVSQIQRNPFQVSSKKNPIIPCYNFPRMSFEPWKEPHYRSSKTGY